MLRRRLLAALLAAAFPTALAPAQAAPDAPPDAPPTADVYVFHGEGCPHCAAALAFLDELRADHPHVRVHAYEVWHDAENRALLEAFARGYRREVRGVPVIVLGDAWWTGFAAPVADGLRTRVARGTPFPDPRARLAADDLAAAVDRGQLPPLAATAAPAAPLAPDAAADTTIAVPLLGTLDLAATPLVLGTALIGLIDGVNPCSLWVLALLVGVVVGTRSRRRVLWVGGTFLTVTAAVYALFIASTFQVAATLTMLGGVRVAVALVAAAVAAVNLKDYVAFGRGVSLTTPDAAKPRIYRGIRRIMHADGAWLPTLAATAVLALGVTIVELPCTAGFPVVWSTWMADAGVAGSGFWGLLAVYVTIYLLDELALFGAAVVTLRAVRMEEDGARVLKLVGGVVMLALAVAMLQAPEALGTLRGTAAVFGGALAVVAATLLLHRIVHPASSPFAGRG